MLTTENKWVYEYLHPFLLNDILPQYPVKHMTKNVNMYAVTSILESHTECGVGSFGKFWHKCLQYTVLAQKYPAYMKFKKSSHASNNSYNLQKSAAISHSRTVCLNPDFLHAAISGKSW